MDGPEDYCIVSHLQVNPEECFVCDATIPKLSHEPKKMISNFNGRTEKTWWQSQNIKEDVYLQVNKYCAGVSLCFEPPVALFSTPIADLNITFNRELKQRRCRPPRTMPRKKMNLHFTSKIRDCPDLFGTPMALKTCSG